MKNPDPNVPEDLNDDDHSVAAWVAHSLVQRGVTRVFGLQGGHIQPIWDFLAKAGVEIIDVRHGDQLTADGLALRDRIEDATDRAHSAGWPAGEQPSPSDRPAELYERSWVIGYRGARRSGRQRRGLR